MAHAAEFIEHVENAAERRNGRPIDLVHLAKQCLGDEGLEREVLVLFDTTIANFLERLELSTTFDELTANLHSIKGASAGVGAWTIAELAKTAEDELRDGRPVNPERIQDIGMAVEEVRSFIAQMLRDAV